MTATLDALDFIGRPDAQYVPALCVVYGDEAFLKRQAVLQLRRLVLGDEADFSLSELGGEQAALRDVLDALSTRPMFGGGRRLVVIEDADPFVTRYRAELEELVARPSQGGVLVLVVESWPSNTRLYKAVAAHALPIECKCPPPAKLKKWLVAWAKQRYAAKLEAAAADALLEVVEPELGLLDQQLAKLASLAGATAAITAESVAEAVSGWRSKTTWDLLDAAAAGNAREALVQLDRLLLGGENPVGLLAQISSPLRRFGAAARKVEQAERRKERISLRQALEAAGVKPFALAKSEAQLRQIGRARAGKLLRQLLQADLALKGVSSAPARARLVLEQLIAGLSAAAAPNPAGATTTSRGTR